MDIIEVCKMLLLIFVSYIIGNISFARILARSQNDDITKHDSGNPGTTNMLRTHGVMFGFLTLFLDMLKGAIPSLIGFFAFGGFDGGNLAKIMIYVAGTSAIIGHCYPVVYGFKGGKGVATAAGMACVAHPIIALILFVCYVVLLIITRIGSLCSLIVALAYITYDSITLGLNKNFVSLGLLIFVLLLIIFKFRGNISRLIHKKENIIDLEAAVNKDIERINDIKAKRRKSEKVSNKLNAETVSDNTKSKIIMAKKEEINLKLSNHESLANIASKEKSIAENIVKQKNKM